MYTGATEKSNANIIWCAQLEHKLIVYLHTFCYWYMGIVYCTPSLVYCLICSYTHTFAHTYTHTHAHTYTHIHAHTHIHTHTCTHTHIHTHTHTYTHIHTHTHTHIHTHTHTHTHTYTHTQYYRKPLLARATTSQPIISERDINTMFYRIEDLYELHVALSAKLEPSLENWSSKTCVNGFFVFLVSWLCPVLLLYLWVSERERGRGRERERERERERGGREREIWDEEENEWMRMCVCVCVHVCV